MNANAAALAHWAAQGAWPPALENALTPKERQLVAVFAGPALASDALRLDPDSPPEKIIRAQLLAHLAAAALSAPQGSPLAYLRSVMLSPGELKGSWLPTMPEDTKK